MNMYVTELALLLLHILRAFFSYNQKGHTTGKATSQGSQELLKHYLLDENERIA